MSDALWNHGGQYGEFHRPYCGVVDPRNRYRSTDGYADCTCYFGALPMGNTCDICGWRRPEQRGGYSSGGIPPWETSPFSESCRRRRRGMLPLVFNGDCQRRLAASDTEFWLVCGTCMWEIIDIRRTLGSPDVDFEYVLPFI